MIENPRELSSPERRTTCFKKLDLVTPALARKLGLTVNKPVFVSSTDSTYDRKPFVYQGGITVKSSEEDLLIPDSNVTTHGLVDGNEGDFSYVTYSRPRFGIGYDEARSDVTTNGCAYWSNLRMGSWVGIVEPKGKVIKHNDRFFAYNRITDELTIREIRAFCCGCKDGPLNHGDIIEPYKNGHLFAVCSSDIHTQEREKNPEALIAEWHFRANLDGAIEIWTD